MTCKPVISSSSERVATIMVGLFHRSSFTKQRPEQIPGLSWSIPGQPGGHLK